MPMYKKLFRKLYPGEARHYRDYIWVFIIVFSLVLLLSQAFFSWLFGPVASGFLWLLLVLWSVFATYFLLFANSHLFYRRIRGIFSHFFYEEVPDKSETDISHLREVEKLQSKPADVKLPGIPESIFEKKLEQEAHDEGALISREGLKYIMRFKGAAERVLKEVIEHGKKVYPRFDGWIVLNKSQVVYLLSHHGAPTRIPYLDHLEAEPKEKDVEEFETSVDEEMSTPPSGEERAETRESGPFETKNVRPPANLPTGTLQSKEAEATGTFLELLCSGDEQGLFSFIREMRQGQEDSIRDFINEAILILDRVHEHRVDGTGYVDPNVLEKTRCFSNEELENIIAILIGSVDFRYALPELGVKLTLVRALEYIKKHRKA